ncbi:NCS2 (YNL119W) [Zygosaccharomyces parabailii]|nr:NCS2 (YNL119W) [Zygosaccharomyces parabailii]
MTETLCKRCGTHAQIYSRKEHFCQQCFCTFVSSKQRKQMMSDAYFQNIFKVMHQDKVRTEEQAAAENATSRVLVPLSLGSSSLTMLDILNDTLKEQKLTQRGKTGFHIDVLICFKGPELNELKKQVHKLSTIRYKENQSSIKYHYVDLESFYNEPEFQLLVLNRKYLCSSIDGSKSNIKSLLEQCPNSTSREDLLTFVTRHLVKRYAFQNNHKAILWGHSMTKLADETMSMVVKGRGEHISSLIDSSQPDFDYGGKFRHLYPLKDVLLSEVDAYCYSSGLDKFLVNYTPQDTLLLTKHGETKSIGKLIKNMTINEMVRKYFDDIENDYSNVISTVVRTADKLAEPKKIEPQEKCSLCKGNIHTFGPNWLRSITVEEGYPVKTEEEKELYRKWCDSDLRSQRDEALASADSIKSRGNPVPLCYGCIITLGGVKNKCVTWPRDRDSELNKTLKEFELRDEE